MNLTSFLRNAYKENIRSQWYVNIIKIYVELVICIYFTLYRYALLFLLWKACQSSIRKRFEGNGYGRTLKSIIWLTKNRIQYGSEYRLGSKIQDKGITTYHNECKSKYRVCCLSAIFFAKLIIFDENDNHLQAVHSWSWDK